MGSVKVSLSLEHGMIWVLQSLDMRNLQQTGLEPAKERLKARSSTQGEWSEKKGGRKEDMAWGKEATNELFTISLSYFLGIGNEG